MKTSKKFIYTLFFAALNGFACSLILKAALGVGAWDSLNNTFADLTHTKIGTWSIIINGGCIVVHYLIDRKNFPKRYLLQILPVLVFGFIVNFFYYDILVFEVNNYILRLLIYFLGMIISSCAVGFITKLDVISFPLESLCNCIATKCSWSFAKIRQSFDICAVIFSVVCCFVFSLTSAVREGTIIGMIIYAPLMAFFMKQYDKVMNKNEN